MQQLKVHEFFKLFDPEVHQDIINSVRKYPDAEAVVVFENVAFDSSQFGRRSALVVGPSNTFTSVEFCKGRWLYDLPSQRQYPQSFIPAADIRSITA